MNKVSFDYYDKQNDYGRLWINGQAIGIGRFTAGYTKKGFAIRHYIVILANNFNMSNRIKFHARSIKGLISQLEKHPYTLCKGR